MAIRKIVKIGDDTLRKVCRPVTQIDKRILTLLGDMAETMYAADGVGLAAPQVGILRRVVVIDVGEGLVELINPEIVATEGASVGPEGCLSVPWIARDAKSRWWAPGSWPWPCAMKSTIWTA